MSNALEKARAGLPENIDELAKFALIGRDKLQAVRAEIAAIKKVGLASDVLEQKRAEAQEIAELVTISEMRMGEMLREIPKASGGDRRSESFKNQPAVNFEKTKSESLSDIGITRNAASQYQQMAEHPDLVEQAIAEARENDDIVSRAAVLKKIHDAKKPHVAYNSGENEWYTPSEYIDAACEVMHHIDLDPASSDIANRVVKASTYYTAEMDGLSLPWQGRIWMNPPYSSDLIGRFIDKLVEEACNINEAIVLVNNATETSWFSKAVGISSAVCFPRGRVKFLDTDGNPKGAPLQGQALLYIGKNCSDFCSVFSRFGWTAVIA